MTRIAGTVLALLRQGTAFAGFRVRAPAAGGGRVQRRRAALSLPPGPPAG